MARRVSGHKRNRLYLGLPVVDLGAAVPHYADLREALTSIFPAQTIVRSIAHLALPLIGCNYIQRLATVRKLPFREAASELAAQLPNDLTKVGLVGTTAAKGSAVTLHLSAVRGQRSFQGKGYGPLVLSPGVENVRSALFARLRGDVPNLQVPPLNQATVLPIAITLGHDSAAQESAAAECFGLVFPLDTQLTFGALRVFEMPRPPRQAGLAT